MNELTFLDLIVLERIDKDTVVERFGSKINSSFFDAANIVGSLKLKGFIDIESSLASNSPVKLTAEGESVLALAQAKTEEDVDALDYEILRAVSKKARDPEGVVSALGIRPSDLAYHLYKLAAAGYLDYNLRNAKVELFLTELGFTSSPQPAKPPAQTEQAAPSTPVKPLTLGEEIVSESKVPAQTPKESGFSSEPSEASIKWARMTSKASFYLAKYMKYIVLFVILLAIFIAVYFSFNYLNGSH
ncbi:MAG: hypothetical protein ABIH99_00745 [Candidatus Micrarchaeota archaeon]